MSVHGAVYNMRSEDASFRVLCPHLRKVSLGCGLHKIRLPFNHNPVPVG